MQHALAPMTEAAPMVTEEAVVVAAAEGLAEEGEVAKGTNPSFYLIILQTQKLHWSTRRLLLWS